jgi:hypothetical protein
MAAAWGAHWSVLRWRRLAPRRCEKCCTNHGQDFRVDTLTVRFAVVEKIAQRLFVKFSGVCSSRIERMIPFS